MVVIGQLTTRQQRFADEYLKTGNAYQSAVTAGYSRYYAENATKKLVEGNKTIAAYLKARQEALAKPAIATLDEVMQTLTLIIRMELLEEVVQLNPVTGEFVKTLKKPDIKEVLRAISEYLKRYPTKLELEKLQLEIDKLRSQVGGEAGQDEKIADFIKLLQGAVTDES